MGQLVMINCKCGYMYDRYRYGVGFYFPEVLKHQTTRIKSGLCGKQWQDLLANDSELQVDASYMLYQCPKCFKITNEFCLDLYKPENTKYIPYTSDESEIVYYYKHLCSECKKKMQQIRFRKNRYGYIYEQIHVVCPKCKGNAVLEFCGFFD